jgi:hypothetical protein
MWRMFAGGLAALLAASAAHAEDWPEHGFFFVQSKPGEQANTDYCRLRLELDVEGKMFALVLVEGAGGGPLIVNYMNADKRIAEADTVAIALDTTEVLRFIPVQLRVEPEITTVVGLIRKPDEVASFWTALAAADRPKWVVVQTRSIFRRVPAAGLTEALADMKQCLSRRRNSRSFRKCQRESMLPTCKPIPAHFRPVERKPAFAAALGSAEDELLFSFHEASNGLLRLAEDGQHPEHPLDCVRSGDLSDKHGMKTAGRLGVSVFLPSAEMHPNRVIYRIVEPSVAKVNEVGSQKVRVGGCHAGKAFCIAAGGQDLKRPLVFYYTRPSLCSYQDNRPMTEYYRGSFRF